MQMQRYFMRILILYDNTFAKTGYVTFLQFAGFFFVVLYAIATVNTETTIRALFMRFNWYN